MRSSVLLAFQLALALAPAELIADGSARGGGDGPRQMYTATVDHGVVAKLVEQGYDVARVRRIPGSPQAQVELVLRPREVAKLKAQGVPLEPWRSADSPGPPSVDR